MLLHLLRRCIKYSFFVGMDVVLDVLDLFEERTDGLPPHLRNYKRVRGSGCSNIIPHPSAVHAGQPQSAECLRAHVLPGISNNSLRALEVRSTLTQRAMLQQDTRGSTCEVRGWIAAMDFLQYCPRPMEPWDGVVSKRLRQVVTRRWICQAYIAKQLDFIIAEAPEELSRVSQYDLRIISRAYETRNPDGEIAPCAWVQSIIERSPRQIRKESSDSE